MHRKLFISLKLLQIVELAAEIFEQLPKANLAKANVSTKNLTKTKLTTEKAQGAKTELIYEQQIGRKTGEWRYERVAPSKVYGRAKLQSRFYSWKQTTFVAQTIALK